MPAKQEKSTTKGRKQKSRGNSTTKAGSRKGLTFMKKETVEFPARPRSKYRSFQRMARMRSISDVEDFAFVKRWRNPPGRDAFRLPESHLVAVSTNSGSFW